MPDLGRPKCLQSMRKQFHFRWRDSSLLAWDVDGLIELARGLPTEMVAVDLIQEIDTNYWFSHHSEPTVRALTTHMRMVNDADLSYPIILDPQGSVLDGMHRVAKALLFEHQFIAARRILTLPEPDYVDVLPEDLPIE